MSKQHLILQANCLHAAGDYEKAEALLLDILADAPDDLTRAEALEIVAAVYRDRESLDTASIIYREAAGRLAVLGKIKKQADLMMEAVWCLFLLESLDEGGAILEAVEILLSDGSKEQLARYHALCAYRSLMREDLHETQEQCDLSNALLPDPWTTGLLLIVSGVISWSIGLTQHAREMMEAASEQYLAVSALFGNPSLKQPLMHGCRLVGLL